LLLLTSGEGFIHFEASGQLHDPHHSPHLIPVQLKKEEGPNAEEAAIDPPEERV
jgi:hypothetical protein